MSFIAWLQDLWKQHGTKVSGAAMGLVGLLQEVWEVASDDIPPAFRHGFHLVVVTLAFVVVKRGFANAQRPPQ